MFNKKFLSTIVPAACGVLAILFALFLSGAQLSEEGGKVTIKLIGLIFGGAKVVAKSDYMSMSIDYSGGMSIFGILAFLAIVGGIALLVLTFLKENNLFALVGNGLLVIGGLAIFFVFIAGTKVNMQGVEMGFTEFIADLKLGFGVYFWAILCVLGGGAGLAAKYFVKE